MQNLLVANKTIAKGLTLSRTLSAVFIFRRHAVAPRELLATEGREAHRRRKLKMIPCPSQKWNILRSFVIFHLCNSCSNELALLSPKELRTRAAALGK